MKRFATYVLVTAAILSGCGRTLVPDGADGFIHVRAGIASVSESPLSKAEINGGNAMSNTLYLNETLRNSFSDEVLNNPANGIYSTGETWQSGEYSFHAYMYSGDGILNIADKGRSLTITQPYGEPSADGSNSDFSDYLLSYTYYVSDGDTRPLVELRMVHATSSVELHFIKPAGASETRVLGASMSGVRNSATYSVTNHADNDVRWAVTPVGDRISYRRSTDGQGGESVFTVPEAGADGSMFPEGSLYFSFLTCQQPVDNSGSPVTIQVDYEINGSPFSSSFSLDKVHGVSNWMAGTKTRYAIVLDSEARLYGSIEPWGDGGEMEGSMIP